MSDEQEYIRVGLNTQNKEENPFKHQDPFKGPEIQAPCKFHVDPVFVSINLRLSASS